MSLLPLCDQGGERRPGWSPGCVLAAGEKPSLQAGRALQACLIPSFREMQALKTQSNLRIRNSKR